MSKLIKLLSNHYISLFIVIVSIVTRIINVLFVSYCSRDKMFLVLQSKSLLEGKGLTIPKYFTTDPTIAVYKIMPLWPPGYPTLLAPFLKLFKYNIYWATTSIDIIFSIALIFIVRKLCKQVGLPIAATNIITLIAGCFEYTFIYESRPTDLVSVVLAYLSIIVIIKLANSNEFSIWRILFTSLLVFLPCLFRYNYPAMSLAIIAAIGIAGFVKKDKLLKRKALLLFIFNAFAIALFFTLMKLFTGHAGYALPTDRGLYPENIVHWFPVVPSAFINIAFLTSQLIHLVNMPFKTSMLWLEVINALAIITLTILFLRGLFVKRFFEEISPLKIFILSGSFASIGLFIFLGYMSLTYQVQTGLENNWNYIYEPRYFAFTVLFLQMVFIAWYFVYLKKEMIKNIFIKTIVVICSFSLFVEVTHNLYFYTKVAFNFKKYKSVVYHEQDFAYYTALMANIETKYPGYEIWTAAPGDHFYQHFATYHDHIGISDADSFKNNTVKVNKNTILILILYDHEIEAYNSFLASVKILHQKKIQNSNFYTIELKP